jgi:hypothetical protein
MICLHLRISSHIFSSIPKVLHIIESGFWTIQRAARGRRDRNVWLGAVDDFQAFADATK